MTARHFLCKSATYQHSLRFIPNPRSPSKTRDSRAIYKSLAKTFEMVKNGANHVGALMLLHLFVNVS
jgi:hypothetical protein